MRRTRSKQIAQVRYPLRLFGSYIGALIDDSESSQAEIAEALGIPRSTLSSYRNGRTVPDDPELLDRMAEVLARWKKDRPRIRREVGERIEADLLSAFMDAAGMGRKAVERALRLIK